VLTKLPLNAVSYVLMRRYPSLLRRTLESIFANSEKVTDEIIAEVQDVIESARNGAPFSNFQRGEMAWPRLRTSFVSDLPNVSCPSLFVHGKEDTLVPLKAVEAAVGSMKNASLEVMDAGHWPMREDPETFNKLVLAFLRDVRS